MKHIFIIAALLALVPFANAAITSSQVYKLNQMNSVAGNVQLGTLIQYAEQGGNSSYNTGSGILNKKIVRAVYNAGVGTNGASSATHALGVTLPANSVITNLFYNVSIPFASTGSPTVGFECEDANNLLAQTSMSGKSANTWWTGVPNGSTYTFVGSIGAACALTARVATADYTSGKLVLFVEYVVTE